MRAYLLQSSHLQLWLGGMRVQISSTCDSSSTSIAPTSRNKCDIQLRKHKNSLEEGDEVGETNKLSGTYI